MKHPYSRPRRLRSSEAIRQMVSETQLTVKDLIVPLFVSDNPDGREEIPSMPGYYRIGLNRLQAEIDEITALNLPSVLIFVKVPDNLKDNEGKEALNAEGLMQQTVRSIKSWAPELIVMTDVALDPYSTFGHDGIVEDEKILNDSTVELLSLMAVSHAEAGADFVAPSDMMDGRILGIRQSLNNAGFADTGIMSYAAKYASGFYGPFRDALDSAPGFGDKKTYQMDPANSKEAIKEARLDQDEGADILMVKPALPYLDVIGKVKANSLLPVAAYQVSGEYAMIKAASEKNWLDHDAVMMETLLAIKRAGADVIATYFAKEAAKLLNR